MLLREVVWTNEEKHGRNSEEPMAVLTQPPQSKLAGRVDGAGSSSKG